ncbi:MAG: archaellum operon transcriptional activator EarA family protein [Euryarchaeota archaeon]|nr:archaellum operon transcriptional activator EarA family protein [Euryarchaeota archaeon]
MDGIQAIREIKNLFDAREKLQGMSEELQFEEVLRSLRRSQVRTEIVMYLYKIYPNAPYPAESSRNTGIDPTNILLIM